jgi:AcrR family transcriptional regulator
MTKRRYDPEKARQDILDAAESLFAAHGFGDISTSKIAKKAGVSQSQIHYHFETKRNLLGEVLIRRFSEYYEIQSSMFEKPDLEGAGLIEESIRAYFQFFQNNPDFVKLLARAQLDNVKEKNPTAAELTLRGTELVARDQEAGLLRDDVSPEFIILGFLSLVAFWFMSRNEYLPQAGFSDEPESYDSQYLEFILKVYIKGILPK